jgi:hypothetical protein
MVNQLPLKQHIYEYQIFFTSNKKGYIYSLLSITSDIKALDIRVHYTRSYTQIFTKVAKALLEKHRLRAYMDLQDR